jgi:hypothetical protein
MSRSIKKAHPLFKLRPPLTKAAARRRDEDLTETWLESLSLTQEIVAQERYDEMAQ